MHCLRVENFASLQPALDRRMRLHVGEWILCVQAARQSSFLARAQRRTMFVWILAEKSLSQSASLSSSRLHSLPQHPLRTCPEDLPCFWSISSMTGCDRSSAAVRLQRRPRVAVAVGHIYKKAKSVPMSPRSGLRRLRETKYIADLLLTGSG